MIRRLLLRAACITLEVAAFALLKQCTKLQRKQPDTIGMEPGNIRVVPLRSFLRDDLPDAVFDPTEWN